MKIHKKPQISIIVAIAKDRAIGKNNQLLWDIPEDLAHFKKVTSGHPVIMGERTFHSIGRLLPKRDNIILTFDKKFKQEGAHVAHSLEEAFELGGKLDPEEIFVIGGGMVYKSALPFANKLYLTVVDGDYDADVYFPEYDKYFVKTIREESHDNGRNKFKFLELVKE